MKKNILSVTRKLVARLLLRVVSGGGWATIHFIMKLSVIDLLVVWLIVCLSVTFLPRVYKFSNNTWTKDDEKAFRRLFPPVTP